MTINDITPYCSRCINSEWMSAKYSKSKPYLRCHKCQKDVEKDDACELFKPSQVVQDYFAGRMDTPNARIVGRILMERKKAGRL